MLTKADHWLRENLILQTHIYTMRMPEFMPRGITVQELPESPTRRYRYRFISKSPKKTDEFVSILKENGLLFTTQVVEEESWLKPIIAPKGRSVIFNIFWLVSFIMGSVAFSRLIVSLKNNPEFMLNLRDAIDLFMNK